MLYFWIGNIETVMDRSIKRVNSGYFFTLATLVANWGMLCSVNIMVL